MLYGNTLKQVKAALLFGIILSAMINLAVLIHGLIEGDLRQYDWKGFIPFTLFPGLIVTAIIAFTTLFQVRIRDGIVENRIAGRTASTASAKDFETTETGPIGNFLVFKNKRMLIFAMHRRELERLVNDLEAAKVA